MRLFIRNLVTKYFQLIQNNFPESQNPLFHPLTLGTEQFNQFNVAFPNQDFNYSCSSYRNLFSNWYYCEVVFYPSMRVSVCEACLLACLMHSA